MLLMATTYVYSRNSKINSTTTRLQRFDQGIIVFFCKLTIKQIKTMKDEVIQ